MIVLALGEVGFIAIAYGEEDEGLVGSIALGIVLLLVAQVFAGGLFVVEEKLLSGYYLDPLKVVGTEGMFGTLYFLIALPIMQSVQCSGPLCNFRYFENSSYAFAQMGDNGLILVYTFGIMLSVAFFNVCGVTTTKLASAAHRSTVDTSRTVLIWIGSVALGFEVFQPWCIPGFVLLVFGTLMYNEIIILPFLGLDQYTKVALEAREGASKRDAAYMTTSPGAGYSAQRNQRMLQGKDDKHYADVGDGAEEQFEIGGSDMGMSSEGKKR